ncbi:MAG: GGIII-like transmembrane region-containing protein, partial [Candidatus Heimdallarchaeota archaeon]
LRHFESAGDTYVYSSDVVSKPINNVTGTVTKATITSEAFSPAECNLEYFMSVDGVNWETVTPGVEYEFINEGSMLQWKVTMTSDRDRSTHLYSIEVNYQTPFLSGSMLWIVIGAGGGLLVIILIIVIAVSVSKRKKKVATR